MVENELDIFNPSFWSDACQDHLELRMVNRVQYEQARQYRQFSVDLRPYRLSNKDFLSMLSVIGIKVAGCLCEFKD